MKGLFSFKNIIIMFGPLIAIVTLLSTGWPQQLLPAVKVGNKTYTVAEYDTCFGLIYNSFTDANAAGLEELGLDLNRELSKQLYDENLTWQEYFREQVLQKLREQTVLLDAGEYEGIPADTGLATEIENHINEIKNFCSSYGIASMPDYFSSYFSAGVNEKIYRSFYYEMLKSEEYRRHLLQTKFLPSDDFIQAYIADNNLSEKYYSASLIVMVFLAEGNQENPLEWTRKIENAGIRADKAMDRFISSGGNEKVFKELTLAHSEILLGADKNGIFLNALQEELPASFSSWCFEESRCRGDSTIIKDDSKYYCIYYLGQGLSSAYVTAREAIIKSSYHEWLSQKLSGIDISMNPIGMRLAR